MAEKKNNKPAEQKPAAQSTELTAENIMDAVKAKNLQNESTVKAALEQIEKEKDEKLQHEAKRAILRRQYRNAKDLIELRQRRAEEKATKAHLTATKDLLDRYLAGNITSTEADEEEKKMDADKRKAFSEAREQYDKDIRELRNAYPGHWSWDWD